MCGIAGFFRSGQGPERAEAILASMLDAIDHRGPDGRGTALFSQACLGHVRLAIIDIAGGSQPMRSRDGRSWISYNGELYNYRELRADLQAQGWEFQTSSDTEVILAAFACHGSECLNSFRGMFAFAFWDEQRQEGYLVRDRFGIKPLFYTIRGEDLVFGSEIKALLRFPGVTPGLDLDGLHLLMNYRYIPGERTLFTHIRHLPAGHLLHWQTGKVTIHKWATAADKLAPPPSLEEVRDRLATAVRRQLVSDVPLGGYLSAGIDSASILALSLNRTNREPSQFPTFTIQTGDSPLEHIHAAETARHFTVPNFQGAVETDLERNLARLIWHLEVPKVNAYQSALVARLARRHVKVALSGLGGDEIFLGYTIHRYLDRLHMLNRRFGPLPRWSGKTMRPIMASLGLHFEEYARGCQVLACLPDFGRVYGIIRNVWDSPEGRQQLYGPRLHDHQPANAFALLDRAWDRSAANPAEACAAFELDNKMVNDLLLQEDRLSMAFGLEVRVPFLDEDLVGMVSALPSSIRMPGGQLKGLLKNAVAQWLPADILNRPKSGFQLPIHEIFDTHLRPLADRYLSLERLKRDGLFNHNFVIKVLQARPDQRLRWHYFLLYLMIGTNIWLDIFEHHEPVPNW
ncbi:MAG: asparagine synthase (glutamine-hydrolyzing) [Desulfobulbaceae bacterium]